MDWRNHPSYKAALQKLTNRLRGKVSTFKRVGPIVFLCGGMESRNREFVEDYLRQRHRRVLFFRAETVWDVIRKDEKANALELESQLGLLADMLLIIVESPGTFAELGAFSHVESLRQKLLPILDKQFEHTGSFIETGPVEWTNKDSRFRPSIWADFEGFADALAGIEDRLARMPITGRLGDKEIADPAKSPKHLLLLACDVVAILGPVSAAHCDGVMRAIVGAPAEWTTLRVLSLAAALQLLRTVRANNDTYYIRPMKDGAYSAYLAPRRMLSLGEERAKLLAAEAVIPAALEERRLLSEVLLD